MSSSPEDVQMVAVLKRSIPVEEITDTCVLCINHATTVDEIWDWAERLTAGSASMIRLEIIKADHVKP